MGANTCRHIFAVSIASKIAPPCPPANPCCRQAEDPFIMVNSAIKSPNTRPVLPRTSSAMSLFFFCGMMELPVENASASSTNRNSQLVQRMISSEKRERCVMSIDSALASSTQKSRSATASTELGSAPAKPSAFAVMPRSIVYVVPANAQAPSGQRFMFSAALFRRLMSRESMNA